MVRFTAVCAFSPLLAGSPSLLSQVGFVRLLDLKAFVR
jgi:hypothetical protein